MRKQTAVLINGKDPLMIKMCSAALESKEYHIIVSNGSYENLTYEIEKFNPDAVIIWNVDDNAYNILEFISKWKYSAVSPFFIVITFYRKIFGVLDEYLPNNAYAILEPVSMDFIEKIIKKAAEGDLSCKPY